MRYVESGYEAVIALFPQLVRSLHQRYSRVDNILSIVSCGLLALFALLWSVFCLQDVGHQSLDIIKLIARHR